MARASVAAQMRLARSSSSSERLLNFVRTTPRSIMREAYALASNCTSYFCAAPNSTVSEFLDILGRQHEIHAELRRLGVSLSRRATWDAHLLATMTEQHLHAPLKTRVLRVAGRVSAEQFAAIYCHDFATEKGSATAVGDLVIVKDDSDALDRAAGLKNRLENPVGAPPPNAGATADSPGGP
jgi:hypothetical protein